MIRVLHVVDSLGVGGAEVWLMELLRLWSRTGEVQIDILLTGGSSGHFDAEARDLGAGVFNLRFGRSHLTSFVRGWRPLLARGGYAAIHDHQEYISGWHFLAGGGLLPPVRIAHVHNPLLGYRSNYGVSPGRRITAAAGWRLVDALATDICGTSARILRENGYRLGRSGRPKVSIVHCGFDIDPFAMPREAARRSVLAEFGWPAESRIVLSVGRIDRALQFDHPQNHKNSWFALNVVRAAETRDPSVRYLIAGAGGARVEMEGHIGTWGLQDRLRFIGLRDDVPRLMRAADVLLFPSAGEGLGMAAVEAQAAGLPVLASTAVPGECVVIPDLYTALSLQQPIDEWATVLLELFSKPRPSDNRCRRAFARSDFAIGNSARILLGIYKAACR
jgi:glycosyltransferase EpsF